MLWVYLKQFPQTTVKIIHGNRVKMEIFWSVIPSSDGGVIKDWEQYGKTIQNTDRG